MKLVVNKNNHTVQTFELFSKDISSNDDEIHYFIGRSSECHVIIDDHSISRNHAELSYIDKKWILKKKSQRAIILVNGISFDEGEIKKDDIIQISNYFLKLIGEENPPEAPSQELQSQDQPDKEESLNEESSSETNVLPEEDLDGEEINDDKGFDPGDGEDQNKKTQSEEFSNEESETSNEDFNLNNDDLNENKNESEEEYNYDNIDGGSELEENEQTKFIKSFVNFELNINGEYTNFDKYFINQEEVFIGRDPNQCQIVLDDPECSQIHAVIRKKGTYCEIQDLNSSNGIILNGARINQSTLSHNDEFLIGNTSFQLIVKSELINEEKDNLMPVQTFEEVDVEEVVEKEVDPLSDEEGTSSLIVDNEYQEVSNKSIFSSQMLKDPKKRKKILIYAVVLLGLWAVLGEESEESKVAENKRGKEEKEGEKDRSLVKDGDKLGDKQKEEEQVKEKSKRSYENLPTDLQEYIRTNYELAKTEILDYGNFSKGLQHLDKIKEYVDEFEQSRSLEITAKEEFKKVEELEKEKKRKQDLEEKKIRVANLMKKADESFQNEKIELTQSLLDKVTELNPESIDASQLRLQLDSYIKEQESNAVREAQEEARRKDILNKLQPGKTLFLKEQWYLAIQDIEKFLQIKDNDDDLIKEATEMLKKSHDNLKNKITPLLKKSRSLLEGQDIKGAYQAYQDVLKVDPTNEESIKSRDEIKIKIDRAAKKIYREALIDESLDYLKEAKEKFQEVKQISPRDSIYYKKAVNKLKHYVDL